MNSSKKSDRRRTLYGTYRNIISGISGNRRITVILLLVITAFNFVILPFFSSKEAPNPLDIRYVYTRSDAADYAGALSEKDRLLQIIMHLTADIAYPAVYTLFMGSLLAGSRLIVFPLILFFSDILENLLITALLAAAGGTALFSFASTLVPFATGIKWILVAANLGIIIIYRTSLFIRNGRDK